MVNKLIWTFALLSFTSTMASIAVTGESKDGSYGQFANRDIKLIKLSDDMLCPHCTYFSYEIRTTEPTKTK